MKTALLLMLILLSTSMGISQELPLILDKQGTFEILSRTDYAGSDCSFTSTEMAANLEKIKELVAIVRKNRVISEMQGFDGRARIYTTHRLSVQWHLRSAFPNKFRIRRLVSQERRTGNSQFD
jgi:hypothetical protein